MNILLAEIMAWFYLARFSMILLQMVSFSMICKYQPDELLCGVVHTGELFHVPISPGDVLHDLALPGELLHDLYGMVLPGELF